MKRNTLRGGFLYVLVGVIFLLCGIFLDTKLNSLFWGFAGAGIIPGLAMICKYVYWTRPQNVEKYVEKMDEEKINLRDERKEKFRNLSGRYAYLLGLITICISIVVFSILSSLGVIQNSKILLFYLGGYVIFQYVAGILIFKHLDKKY
ncbi:hypothetical protein NRIC_09800 [Enterococcus florum]|uniref:Uncharacterized protein n=1 Tax=Enterococcus florum TaxID=2480627 RepID=A0A4V0WP96_9ENTE|nr:hypothetical protein [Enterococcus florum]GCF93089.1 hypothetical protein NRIC_09800 [Enterococcus florum]